MDRINVVILAGGEKKEIIQNELDYKALLKINGKSMVEYVVDALRMSLCVGKISIVGPTEPLRGILGDRVDYYLHGEGSLLKNIMVGCEPFKEDNRVLLVTSDIPLITGSIISEFISECSNYDADFCYPILEKSVNDVKFPEIRRTYARLREGTFTGGNIFYINPGVLKSCEDFINKALASRKNPWKMSRLLGFRFLIMFFLGMLSIPKIEKRFSELLRIKAVAVITTKPELANDVDKPSDIRVVQDYFRKMEV